MVRRSKMSIIGPDTVPRLVHVARDKNQIIGVPALNQTPSCTSRIPFRFYLLSSLLSARESIKNFTVLETRRPRNSPHRSVFSSNTLIYFHFDPLIFLQPLNERNFTFSTVRHESVSSL